MIKNLTTKEVSMISGSASGYFEQLAEWLPYALTNEVCKRLAKTPGLGHYLHQNPALDLAFSVGCFIGAKSVGYFSKQFANFIYAYMEAGTSLNNTSPSKKKPGDL